MPCSLAVLWKMDLQWSCRESERFQKSYLSIRGIKRKLSMTSTVVAGEALFCTVVSGQGLSLVRKTHENRRRRDRVLATSPIWDANASFCAHSKL